MKKHLQRRYRYDFFTIWGNGLKYAENILSVLRSEENIEILRIELRHVKNMRKFVFRLYGCDFVPIWHLKAKLKYLFNVSPKILNVFVKNIDPHEAMAGEGAFRKVQCQEINRIKWYIRELYNPRNEGKRSEEHVIHSSDHEAQVDYYLKMIGYGEGIRFLENDAEGLPFEKPYYIKRPKTYVFKKLPLKALRAVILQGTAKGENKIARHYRCPIERSPHFLSLMGGHQYEDYLRKYRYIFLTSDHYPEKLYRMKELGAGKVDSFPRIIVKLDGNNYSILDGLHRAAVAMYHGYTDVQCVEVII